MKKFILILIMIIALNNISLSNEINFKISSLNIKKMNKNQYSVNFTVSYPPNSFLFSETTVPITTEPLIISGKLIDNKIREQDFLYSAFNYDLNGDGDFNDVFTISKKNDYLYLNKKMIEAIIHPRKHKKMMMMKYQNENGNNRIYRITEKGNTFILYSHRKNKILFGLSQKRKPVTMKNFANPNVQIMVMKLQDKFIPPEFSIQSYKNYTTFSNEKIEDDQMDQWENIVWSIIPLVMNNKSKKTAIFVNITKIKPPFHVFVFVNCSVVRGVRMRFGPRFSRIN